MVAYWLISHNPDCNETGMFQNRTYLKTTWVGFPMQRACELEIIRDWCRERFGSEVAFVQGIAATPGWRVAESTAESFENPTPIRWGGYETETRCVEMTIDNGGKLTIVRDEKCN